MAPPAWDSFPQVFQALFEYVDDNWSKLSPEECEALKDRPLVPVGARLIKAGRLFFRLKVTGRFVGSVGSREGRTMGVIPRRVSECCLARTWNSG